MKDSQFNPDSITLSIRNYTSGILALIIFFGWTIAIVYGALQGGSILVFQSLLWAMTALVSGALIGFLFGLPKVNSKGDTNKVNSKLIVSRNLEEVADWLTKIIVGVSLVEFKDIASKIHHIAILISQDDHIASTFTLPLLIFNFVIGAIATYILIRLYLTEAMVDADKVLDGMEYVDPDVKKEIADASIEANFQEKKQGRFLELNYGSGNKSFIGRTAEGIKSVYDVHSTTENQIDVKKLVPNSLSSSASAVASLSFTYLDNADSLALWARAQYLKKDYVQAAKGYTAAIEKKNDPLFLLEYALTLIELEESDEKIIATLKKAVNALNKETPQKTKKKIYETLTFYQLYVDKKYDEVIKYCEKYIREGGVPSGRLFINLACAYGQMASEQGNDSKQIPEIEQKVITAIRNARQVDGDGWDELLKILLTNDDPENNDLYVFSQIPNGEVKRYINSL